MVRSLQRRKDIADSIADGLDGKARAELAETPPPGRKAFAWVILAALLAVPIGILLYLLY